MRMQKIEGTERVDEQTGQPVATYVFDNGEEIDMSDDEYVRLVGVQAPPPADVSMPAAAVPPANVSADSAKLFNNYVATPPPAPIPAASSAVAQPMTPADIANLKSNLAAKPAQAPLVGPPQPEPAMTPAPQTAPVSEVPATPMQQYATTSEYQTQQTLLPEDVKKKQLDAFDKANEAAKSAADAQIAANNFEAAHYQKQAVEAQKFIEEEARQKELEQAKRDEMKAKIDAAAAKYDGMEVDSGRYWANKGVGSKILAAIAVGLGAYAQSMGANRENPALTMIRAAIDNDIKAQEANMIKAGKSLEAQRGMYSDFVKELGDKELARLKTHEMGLKAAETAMQGQLGKVKNQAVAANLEATLAQSAAQRADLQAKQEAIIANKTTRTEPLKTKDLTGTTLEQHTMTLLSDSVKSIEAANELEQLVQDASVTDDMGVLKGRFTEVAQKLGIELDPKTVEFKNKADLLRLAMAKFFSGTGQGIQERAEFKAMSASLTDNPKNALSKIRAFKSDALMRYKKDYDLQSRNYRDPTAVSSIFPSPEKLLGKSAASNKYGFKPAGK